MNLFKRTIFILCMSLSIISCASADDNRVTMKNIEEFKIEFSCKLPVGTPKNEVISYLDSLSINYTYLDNKKKIYASIPKVGRYRLIYVTSLFIRIKLDESERLEKIEFDLQHDGL